MSISDYQKPVSELLQYGDPRLTNTNMEEWRNYVEELQLTEEHIPELIKMMTDDELNYASTDSLEVWSSLHAWRALAQLKAESAIIPLLDLLNKIEEDDWIIEDLPKVCWLIGVKTIPILANFLENSDNDLYARVDVSHALSEIGQKYPEVRSQVVEIITKVLASFTDNDPEFNGFLVSDLIELKATESMTVIEEAFQANRVNEFIVGTWEEVQVDMGLKPKPSNPRQLRQPRQSSSKKPFAIKSPNQSSPKSVKGFGNHQTKGKKSSKKSKSKKKK